MKENREEMVIRWVISRAIRDIGIPASLAGHLYLSEAVRLAVDDLTVLSDLTGNLCEPIAQRYGTTPQRVRDAIARAIAIGWDRAELNTLDRYFGHDAYNVVARPSVVGCIDVLAETVCRTCKALQKDPKLAGYIPAHSDKTARELAGEVLNKLELPSQLKGFSYLVEAVALAEETKSTISALYPAIAQQFCTTPSAVANAISRAVELTWDRGDLTELESIFGYTVSNTKGKPTNAEFIAALADKIHWQLV